MQFSSHNRSMGASIDDVVKTHEKSKKVSDVY